MVGNFRHRLVRSICYVWIQPLFQEIGSGMWTSYVPHFSTSLCCQDLPSNGLSHLWSFFHTGQSGWQVHPSTAYSVYFQISSKSTSTVLERWFCLAHCCCPPYLHKDLTWRFDSLRMLWRLVGLLQELQNIAKNGFRMVSFQFQYVCSEHCYELYSIIVIIITYNYIKPYNNNIIN